MTPHKKKTFFTVKRGLASEVRAADVLTPAPGQGEGSGGVETWSALCLHSTPIPAFPLPGGRCNSRLPLR